MGRYEKMRGKTLGKQKRKMEGEEGKEGIEMEGEDIGREERRGRKREGKVMMIKD